MPNWRIQKHISPKETAVEAGIQFSADLGLLEPRFLFVSDRESSVMEGSNEKMSEAKRYLANSDVSCREEGPDEGAILFNPDTDTILVINPTGLLLWRALEEQPRTQDELVAHLLENCDDVPTDQVAADVEAFLQALQPGEFIGEGLEDDGQ